MKPVDGRARDLFGHALDAIVERIAVVTVEVALKLGEQVRHDGVEIAGQKPRLEVRKCPPSHRVMDLSGGPVTPTVLRKRLAREQLSPAWERRVWEFLQAL